MAAAVHNLRQRDAELAVGQLGAAAARVARAQHPDRSHKTAELTLNETERRFGTRTARGFFPQDQHRIAPGEHANGRGVDTRHVDHDLDGIIALVNVDRGHAFANQRLSANALAKVLKGSSNVVLEFGGLGRNSRKGITSAHER